MTELELKQKIQQECIERLKILETKYSLSKNVRKEFKTDGTIYYSEDLGGPFKGILYWFKEEWLQKMQEIEELYNIKIYYGILTHFDFGDVLSLLYVSNDLNDWQIERKDLTDGVPFVYALNLTDEWMSEFGGIQIEGNNGGLSRVY